MVPERVRVEHQCSWHRCRRRRLPPPRPRGCIILDFRLTGDNRGEPLAMATQVVGAVSRADLRDQVHDESDGRLQLDPPEGEG